MDGFIFILVFIIVPIIIGKLMAGKSYNASSQSICKDKDESPDESPKERTRRILGDELYEYQRKVVSNVNETHKYDESIIVRISTVNGISVEGQIILSKVLPGDKVELNWNKKKSVIRVEKVGVCIGHVSDLSEEEVGQLIMNNKITGVYIYSQDSYNQYPSSCYFVKLIIYYRQSDGRDSEDFNIITTLTIMSALNKYSSTPSLKNKEERAD